MPFVLVLFLPCCLRIIASWQRPCTPGMHIRGTVKDVFLVSEFLLLAVITQQKVNNDFSFILCACMSSGLSIYLLTNVFFYLKTGTQISCRHLKFLKDIPSFWSSISSSGFSLFVFASALCVGLSFSFSPLFFSLLSFVERYLFLPPLLLGVLAIIIPFFPKDPVPTLSDRQIDFCK